MNYAKYGPNSAFTDIIPESRLKQITPKDLVEKIKQLTTYKHRIFYYGQKELKEVKDIINRHHEQKKRYADYPDEKKFAELETNENKVLFVHYDMVQAQVLFISKGEVFNPQLVPYASLFGEYFGSGLSSITFQEIREARALAYSAFSAFTSPRNDDQSHYVYGYVATQVDKMEEASEAMLELMNNMPKAPQQFNSAKEATLKKI